jgi:hypothetical protein
VCEIGRYLDASDGHRADGSRSSEQSTEKAHPRIDLINADEEPTVATAHRISATKAATTHARRSLRNRSIETGLCRV